MKKVILIAVLFCLSFSPLVFADGFYWKTKVIDDNDTWTDPVPVKIGHRLNYRVHPNASPDMTIYLQNKYRRETDWYDVEKFVITGGSVDSVKTTSAPEPEPVEYRIGCKIGGCTSGNCTVRVGTGARVR